MRHVRKATFATSAKRHRPTRTTLLIAPDGVEDVSDTRNNVNYQGFNPKSRNFKKKPGNAAECYRDEVFTIVLNLCSNFFTRSTTSIMESANVTKDFFAAVDNTTTACQLTAEMVTCKAVKMHRRYVAINFKQLLSILKASSSEPDRIMLSPTQISTDVKRLATTVDE
ncbi:hypothetical protein CHUAL_013098 [Chamberlinius hualienensis]